MLKIMQITKVEIWVVPSYIIFEEILRKEVMDNILLFVLLNCINSNFAFQYATKVFRQWSQRCLNKSGCSFNLQTIHI